MGLVQIRMRHLDGTDAEVVLDADGVEHLGRRAKGHDGRRAAVGIAAPWPAEVLDSIRVEHHFGVGSVQVPHPDLDQPHLLIHPRKDRSA